MAEPNLFDKMLVVNSRDFGYPEDWTIHLVYSNEGIWVATEPKSGFAEIGATKAEAVQHLVDNLKVYSKRQFNA